MQSTDQTAPGLAETAAQTEAALPAAMAQSDARQVEAGRFITDHGHQVVGGHAPVTQGQDQRGRSA